MVGLFFSSLILYLVAVVAGFAIGWWARVQYGQRQQEVLQGHIDQMAAALREAQVRRGSMS